MGSSQGTNESPQARRIVYRSPQSVFYDDRARLVDDPDHSESEDRFILVGLSEAARVLVVVHAYREPEGLIRSQRLTDRPRPNRGRSVSASCLRAGPQPELRVRHHGVRTRREGAESSAAAPEVFKAEEAMKQEHRFPAGWNAARVQRVLDHYEAQSDVEATAEDEAAYRSTTTTVMKIPVKLVPKVRALLAKRRAS